jgi:hypothetical protein
MGRAIEGYSAWLVTWEGTDVSRDPASRIVEILDPRMSPKRVRHVVELLYHRGATHQEKIRWRLRKEPQPYGAEFATVAGGQWEGRIVCGHSPWLSARLVDHLKVWYDDDGTERASWDERASPREVKANL